MDARLMDAPHTDAPLMDAPPRDAPPRGARPRDTSPRDSRPRDTSPKDSRPLDIKPVATVLIIGATSAIAEACARLWAPGCRMHLVARNREKLETVATDLQSRGATVTLGLGDLRDLSQHAALIESAFATLGTVNRVLVAYGTLPDQPACEASVEATLDALLVNGTSVISLVTLVAQRLSAQGQGQLAVIGSVAGDRGRQSNYVYGAAKAAVATFLEGLTGRLRRQGVQVLTIKPGFVDTPMTAHFRKGILWAQPATVAQGIDRALRRGGTTVYVPGFWRWIMLVVVCIPQGIFVRMRW